MMDAISSLAEALWAAIDRGDFAGVESCAAAYGESVRRAVGDLPPCQRAEYVRAAYGEMESARRRISLHRARMAARLRRCKAADGYLSSGAQAGAKWSVSG